MGQLIPYNSNSPPDGTVNARHIVISREVPVEGVKNEIDERKNIENTHKLEPENQKVYELLVKQIQEKESQLKCPVCYETVSSPIFMCHQMQHLICSSCRPRLTKCPVCRENYDHIPRRHRYAEKDADELQAMREEMLKITYSTSGTKKKNQEEEENESVRVEEDKRQCGRQLFKKHKCCFCDFRSPYLWVVRRHVKSKHQQNSSSSSSSTDDQAEQESDISTPYSSSDHHVVS